MLRKVFATVAAVAVLASCGAEPPTAIRAPSAPHRTLDPLSVTISGPRYVQPNTYCTWTAYPSGGTAPYTYDWIGGTAYDLTNQQSYIAMGNTTNHTLTLSISVTVTDANNETVTYSTPVTSMTSAPSC